MHYTFRKVIACQTIIKVFNGRLGRKPFPGMDDTVRHCQGSYLKGFFLFRVAKKPQPLRHLRDISKEKETTLTAYRSTGLVVFTGATTALVFSRYRRLSLLSGQWTLGAGSVPSHPLHQRDGDTNGEIYLSRPGGQLPTRRRPEFSNALGWTGAGTA